MDPSFSKSSSTGARPVFREITKEEYSSDLEEIVQEEIKVWSSSLEHLPPLTHEKIHSYMVLGESFDSKERGAVKHKISGYQLFKDGYVKKVRVKPNVKVEKLSFIVKSFAVASMKKDRYTVYVHLCQLFGDILYGKCNCKAGASGCCKHAAALLYQLVEFKQLNLDFIPDDKTCTDQLQQWHVPGEGMNHPIKFSELKFEKADLTKDLSATRKRPLVCGKRKYCASPIFAHTPSEEKIKQLSDGLFSLGQGTVFANLLKGNNYAPSYFYDTSITAYNSEKEEVKGSRQVDGEVMKLLNGCLELTLIKADDQDFVKSQLQLSHANVIHIESSSIQQSFSNVWHNKRKKRLTESNFGYVINRRKNIFPKSILEKCFPENLKKPKIKACEWGKENESTVLTLYQPTSLEKKRK